MKSVKVINILFSLLFGSACIRQVPAISDEKELAPTLEMTVTAAVNIIEKVDDLAVDSLQVVNGESFPGRIVVMIAGSLPDTCTYIDDIEPELADSVFELEIIAHRKTGPDCVTELQPFEQQVLLNVDDLPAGRYGVSLNDLTASFILEEDIEIPDYESG